MSRVDVFVRRPGYSRARNQAFGAKKTCFGLKVIRTKLAARVRFTRADADDGYPVNPKKIIGAVDLAVSRSTISAAKLNVAETAGKPGS